MLNGYDKKATRGKTNVKYCIECNEQLYDDAKFCSNCRAKQPEEPDADFSEFKEILANSDEILEKIYTSEFEKVKTKISELKQEAELPPYREGTSLSTMSERIENSFVTVFSMITNFMDTFSDNACDKFYRECYKYLSHFSELIDTSGLTKQMPNIQPYYIGDTDVKPWTTKKKENGSFPSNIDPLINIDPWEITNPLEMMKLSIKIPWEMMKSITYGLKGELDDFLERSPEHIKGVLDASQEYINSIINKVEQHCFEVLTTIKLFYGEQLKIILAPVSEKNYGNGAEKNEAETEEDMKIAAIACANGTLLV